jgi:hypothetical protein
MSSFTFKAKLLAGGIFVMAAASIAPTVAQQQSAPPDFSSNNVGWVGLNGGGPFFEPVPGRIPPVAQDPAHPFVPNGVGKQPTYRIADLTNPNLKPWVKEIMKTDKVLAGKVAFTAGSSCQPLGVPGFMSQGGPNPMYFLQTPKEVWIILPSNQQVRRIYMNVPHSENPTPSWYGESVGHYEGDTLVVDTVALSDKAVLDVYRTPHTDKLHVVERWRMTDGGKMMEATFTVDDPDAFNEPWSGMRRYRRAEREDSEMICAENNQHLFDYHVPVADKPDF